MKKEENRTSDDIMLSGEGKILTALLATIIIGGGTVGYQTYNKHEADALVKEGVSRFYKTASDGLQIPLPDKKQGILSIEFTSDEAKNLSTVLKDEQAMARIFVERLSELMVHWKDAKKTDLLDEAFRGTFKMNRSSDTNIDGVIQTYQIFKQAIRRMENKNTGKTLNPAAAQALLNKRGNRIG